ncbi:MAG TPA: hypothetical protein VHK47_21610 [Polyangia bacterium]|jgi:hypothetical protein|nr:hypothetical protein [Polyangia bacterium]
MGEGVIEEGTACRPNISSSGVRLRRRFGAISAGAAALVAGGLVVTHARWPWSFAVFLPAALAGVGFLQASRRTCVARAREGTFEHDDFSKTPAASDDVQRSRKVAAGINRDAALIGLGAVALTMLATKLSSGS